MAAPCAVRGPRSPRPSIVFARGPPKGPRMPVSPARILFGQRPPQAYRASVLSVQIKRWHRSRDLCCMCAGAAKCNRMCSERHVFAQLGCARRFAIGTRIVEMQLRTQLFRPCYSGPLEVSMLIFLWPQHQLVMRLSWQGALEDRSCLAETM